MPRENGVYWFVLALGFVLILGSVGSTTYQDTNDAQSAAFVSKLERSGFPGGSPHAPIVIDGDANFSETALAEGWHGNGSWGYPYDIRELEIDRAGTIGHCISISNTQSHFMIHECILTGANMISGSGISLYNVTNGGLWYNNCTNNYNGIHLVSSSSNIVAFNTCDNNDHGIYVFTGGNNTLARNTCGINNVNGIVVISSLSNNVTRNTCNNNIHHGIHLHSRISNNRVADNYCNNNSYGILINWNCFDNIVDSNTCTNNDQGIRIQDSWGLHTLNNNTCTGNVDGIHISNSILNDVTNNTCISNSDYAINIRGGYSNTIANNICDNSSYGIYLSSILANNTNYNTITNNTCSNNNYGFYLRYSSYNDILWNAFVDSFSGNVYLDQSTNNVFDYNYWSDYSGIDANQDGFGDAPYVFTGDSDPHPLIYLPYPPSWTAEFPAEWTAEWPYSFRYDFDASAPAPIFWSVNDTMRFFIDDNGVLESLGILPIGDYGLRMTVANIYGMSISAVFRITVVLDAMNPPGWWTIPTNQVLVYGEEFDYQVTAIDPSGIDHWELNDTIHFAIGASYFEGGSTARITTQYILEPSSYGLNLTVYDIYDNKLSATFTVVVEPREVTATTTTTITTTTTNTTTTSTTPGGIDPVLTLVLGTGIGGAAVVVIVIVFLRRKS
ncbi:MAG: NosD domain-containing protein [Candidatus Thorarchaeota archaeon]